jgi:hypothetical protein
MSCSIHSNRPSYTIWSISRLFANNSGHIYGSARSFSEKNNNIRFTIVFSKNALFYLEFSDFGPLRIVSWTSRRLAH